MEFKVVVAEVTFPTDRGRAGLETGVLTQATEGCKVQILYSRAAIATSHAAVWETDEAGVLLGEINGECDTIALPAKGPAANYYRESTRGGQQVSAGPRSVHGGVPKGQDRLRLRRRVWLVRYAHRLGMPMRDAQRVRCGTALLRGAGDRGVFPDRGVVPGLRLRITMDRRAQSEAECRVQAKGAGTRQRQLGRAVRRGRGAAAAA